MKQGSFTTGRILMALILMAASISLVSWKRQQTDGKYQQAQFTNDTIPKKKDKDRERKVRDLDEAIAELENVDIKLHMEEAMKEVAIAMKQLDADKIKMEVDKAMKEVDFAQVKKEIEKAMKEVDMNKIKAEIDASMAKINWEEIQAEVEKAKKVDYNEIKIQMEKAKEEMKNIQPKLEKELQNAQVEMEKAKATMKEYKTFVDGLDKDGLIDKKAGYSLEHKNGKLLINDKEASKEVYQQYRSFLDKHPKFNIEKDNDDFNIDMD